MLKERTAPKKRAAPKPKTMASTELPGKKAKAAPKPKAK